MSSERQSVHSYRCSSAAEFFLPQTQRCEQCTTYFGIVPGKEFAPNCGLSDDGGRHEALYKDCPTGTFNSGNSVWCQKCSTCPSSHSVPCTVTSDTYCCKEGQNDELGKCRDVAKTSKVRSAAFTTTQTMTTTPEYPAMSSPVMTTNHKVSVTPNHFWTVSAISVIILLSACCLMCLAYIFMKKKNQGCRELKRRFSKGSRGNHVPLPESREYFKEDAAENIKDMAELLSPEIQASPLQSVLNNMDVVEELVLLLDPDIPGAKNTRHLAASCSIPFNWINYAYSMKDSRSPLIAVLEKVIAKYPYWNVGNLAVLLSNIGRNDAVTVLGKLSVTAEEV